jgi:DNA modification methylase
MNFKCAYTDIYNLAKIVPNPKNKNIHPDKQIKVLAKIIDARGQRSPIVISKRSGFITKGHGRLMAIKMLGWDKAAVDLQDYESEAEEYADMIADNEIARYAEFDKESFLEDLNIEDFDPELYGLIDFEIPAEKLEPQCDEDDVPEVVNPITKRGDIWLLGNHRLMCGDSTMIDDVEKLMDGEKADLLHTDPPYNVGYSNADRPKAGKIDHGLIKNDKMDEESFYEFLFTCFSNALAYLKDDSSAYIWYASKESVNFLKAIQEAGFEINQQIIWKKPMLLGRGRYQWAHEPCIFAVKGKPFFTDDRKKTTVWDFGGYDKSKNIHPTQKPVFLPEEAINNSSKQGSIILDLFNGSGSTMIGCEKTGRSYRGIELDERFVDATIKRWQNFTGKKATLESNGQTYDELKEAAI